MGRRSQNSKRGLSASHQRSWLWGRHAVMEMLAAGKWPVVELMIDDGLPREIRDDVAPLAARAGVRIQQATSDRLTELCRAQDHQGFLARMGEFPCDSLDDLRALAKSISHSESDPIQSLFVICDRIQDAHNFGAILRCCDALKVTAVIIGEKCQVSVSPHVARASSGAVNYLRIVRVAELSTAVEELKSSGVQVLAASEKSKKPVWQHQLTGPLAIVIGSEGTGIAAELLNQCDLTAAIPMLGEVGSLNAAVAAGIVLYECRRQQLAR